MLRARPAHTISVCGRWNLRRCESTVAPQWLRGSGRSPSRARRYVRRVRARILSTNLRPAPPLVPSSAAAIRQDRSALLQLTRERVLKKDYRTAGKRYVDPTAAALRFAPRPLAKRYGRETCAQYAWRIPDRIIGWLLPTSRGRRRARARC